MSSRSIVRGAIFVGLFLIVSPVPAQDAPPGPPAKTGYLGVVSSLTNKGCLVEQVVAGSPAEQAGLQKGEFVTAVDGYRVGVIGKGLFSLPSEIRRSSGLVKLSVLSPQSNQVREVEVNVGGDTQPFIPPRQMYIGAAMRFRDDGEYVERVLPDSPAARAGLRVGDVVTALDGYKVGRVNGQIYSVISEIRRSRSNVVLTVRRGGTEMPLRSELIDQSGASTTKVNLLLVALTDDQSIGQAVSNNLAAVQFQIDQQIPPERQARKIVLVGRDCNQQTILNAVRSLQIAPTEALFCYFAGHGAYDPNYGGDDPAGGHFLQLEGPDLLRKDLIEGLLRHRARLTVLITDTCNVQAPYEPTVGAPPPPPPPPLPALQALLLKHAGTVDINGASKDQFGFALDMSLFSEALVDVLKDETNNTWPVVLAKTQAITDLHYQAIRNSVLGNPQDHRAEIVDAVRNQEHQMPFAFQMYVEADPDVVVIDPNDEEVRPPFPDSE
jgi:hypothetical protein